MRDNGGVNTELSINGESFYINGKPTYEGCEYDGRKIEGLLFNTRMIQAIFDDANPETAKLWRYPDTGVWDPQRNTNEFCEQLKAYKDHGVLGVTVGLQGGGSIYTPDIYENYLNSAFTLDGELIPAYVERLHQVLKRADELGMVVIVNFFYVSQVKRMSDEAVLKAAENGAAMLLEFGYKNILVDAVNEANKYWGRDIFLPENVHRVIEAIQSVSLNGRRLPVGASTLGEEMVNCRSIEIEDIALPHGNHLSPLQLKNKIRLIRGSKAFQERPRPVIVNEDGIVLENMYAAIDEYASWGFYCQGYGSDYEDIRIDWRLRPRETEYDKLSGFQTIPVNWSINTDFKKNFFSAVKAITGGCS